MVEENQGSGENRWRIALWGGVVLLLLLPLAAMQVSDEVAWTAADFALAAALLGGAALLFELAARRASGGAYGLGMGIAMGAALLLVWANGAVGILGNEENAANLLYLTVLAVGVVGALLGRFRPAGMACALAATTLAHLLIGLIALVAGWGTVRDILLATLFFGSLFAGAAVLFQRAAHEEPEGDAAR